MIPIPLFLIGVFLAGVVLCASVEDAIESRAPLDVVLDAILISVALVALVYLFSNVAH